MNRAARFFLAEIMLFARESRLPLAAFVLVAGAVLLSWLPHRPQPLANASPDYESFAPDSAPAQSTDGDEEQTVALAVPPSLDSPAVPPAVIEPPAAPPAPPWLQYRIRKRDRTFAKVLVAIGADDESRNYLLSPAAVKRVKSYRKLRPGSIIDFQKDAAGRLLALRYKTSPEYYLRFWREESGAMQITEEPPRRTRELKKSAGVIDSSLYQSLADAGVGDDMADLMIDALETRVDFYRDVRSGDSFRLVFERETDEDGDPLPARRGQLRAFEFDNRGREIRGVYDPQAKAFYSPDGRPLAGAFLRAPLKFRRISSGFSLRRFHPVLKKWRAHRGTDYAARRGTPVRSTADGVVTFAGRKSGYGKVIYIKHFNIYTTVYGHLHRIAKGVRKGARVSQGQVIGKVGSTGLATGPHLHYEFRVRGVHKDPLSNKVPRQAPALVGDDLRAFQGRIAADLALLESIADPVAADI